MQFKVKLAKTAMNLFPSNPVYDTRKILSELVNHRNFIDASDEEKRRILYEMAYSHYMDDQIKPFDTYFPGYNFNKLFSDKKILDLGCWCGGKAVSYAERWNVKYMYGIDINEHFISAAKLFSSKRENREIVYNFDLGFGESLPYEDSTFDAIVSWDVFEHVKSVKKTISECKRILKPGGMLVSVFPSYYFPFGGDHLGFATSTPFINWLFDPCSLDMAYNEIIESRGEEAYWYKTNDNEYSPWKKLHGGIGTNGVTFRDFRNIITEIGFSNVNLLPTPLLSVGIISINHPKSKYISKFIKPFLYFKVLEDYLSHRIVSVLTV
jgi:SAM-dependent methyltransferase